MLFSAALAAPSMAVADCPTASAGGRCGAAFAEAGAAKRVAAEAPQQPRFGIGDVLPQGRFFVLLGSEYYGLPPSDGAWRYYRVEDRVLRVRPDTLEIIEDATAEANGAF